MSVAGGRAGGVPFGPAQAVWVWGGVALPLASGFRVVQTTWAEEPVAWGGSMGVPQNFGVRFSDFSPSCCLWEAGAPKAGVQPRGSG